MNDATAEYIKAVNHTTPHLVKKSITFAAAARATLATALTGSNNDLDFSAVLYGTAGNNITVEYKDPGVPSASLSVAVVNNDITVNLATGGGTNEVQTLTVSASGGSFVLSFRDTSTTTLPYNVSAAALKAALESVPTIGTGNIDVSLTGSVYTITFQGSLAATNVPLLVVDDNNLAPKSVKIETLTTVVGSASPATNEVQKVQLQGATVGTFTLTFNGQTTSALAFDASAATVQTALRALSSINGANVNVTKTGSEYTLTFVGTLAAANQPQTTASATGLQPSAVMVQTTPGAAYAITSTAAQIDAAIAASDAADALVLATNHSGNDGTGIVTAMAKTSLAGGAAGNGTPAASATLATALTGSNNDLDFTAVAAGAAGNGITIAYVDPGGTTASLSVVVDVQERAITVNLARAASAITTTAADITAALAANTDAAALVTSANHSGNDGTGIVTAMAATALSGGSSNVTLFNVQGNCLVALTILPTTTLTGASATFKVGTSTDDDVLIPSTTATNVARGIIVDKTGVVTAGTAPVTTPFAPLVDTDAITLKAATASISGGAASFYAYYLPLDENSRVIAA